MEKRGANHNNRARGRLVCLLLLTLAAPREGVCQQATIARAASMPSAALSQRDAQLQSDLAQLNRASSQLQNEIDRAGTDTLSLRAVQLSQEVQALAQRIEAEIKAE